MKKLKIGIIGVGRLGYEHACNIANRVPGSELVAIADANFDRAKQVAEELGVTAVYNDPKALCADPNVEAVAIIPILHLMLKPKSLVPAARCVSHPFRLILWSML